VATLIVDQNCKPADGIRIPLLGQEVWTNISFARLSLRLGAPIIPGFICTKGLGEYELCIGRPLYPEEFKKQEDPAKEMASAFYWELDQAIQKSPGQWMWQHRRFKNLS
jgi:KDO2-lipid IV(A) lauroyltransferase